MEGELDGSDGAPTKRRSQVIGSDNARFYQTASFAKHNRIVLCNKANT